MSADAESILKKIRDQNKARQDKFYKANKDTINERRRKLYQAGKKALLGLPVEPAEAIVVPEQAIVETPIVEPLTKSKKAKNGKTKTNKTVITYNDAVAKLTQLRQENIIKTDGTLKKYKEDLNRFVKITGCDDVSECLKKYSLIINDIHNGEKNNGEPYSTNSLKSVYQAILFIIDNFPLPDVNKQPYDKEYNILILQSNDENAEKKENEEVLPFKAYLEKAKEKWGENSKIYLIASLYYELTVRDDFQLKMVNSMNDMTDDKVNYLYVPKSGNLKITINTYKTEMKYGVINHTCSKSLSSQIRKYMTDNKLTIGDYLFGSKKLTQFVSSQNPYINIKGGVSLFRNMKVSDELKTITTPEQRLALADKMRHSPVSQLWYLRKQKLL